MKNVALLAVLCSCATSETFAGMDCVPIPEYDRSDWGRWVDEDGDCQDTRQEVLIAESVVPVTFEDGKTCRVETGKWVDPYTGEIFTDPGGLDVDHMVALRDAHGSGAYTWSGDKKRQYFNSLENPSHLIAVSASANRSKGSRGPDEWLPPKAGYRCQYIQEWVGVKNQWGLSMSQSEATMVEYMLRICDRGEIPTIPQ